MALYSLIGLIIIIIAWLIQFFSMNKKNSNKINKFFVGIYCIGVLILVYDGFSSGLKDLAVANLVSLIVSFAVFLRFVLKK